MPQSNVRITMNRFPEVRARVKGSVGQAVRDVTLDLLSQAVREAPVKEGVLRGSGTAHFGNERIASGAQFDSSAEGDEGVKGGAGSNETTGVVAFNTEYAVAQHERTDFNHPKGGKAKYLEDPVERNREQYQRHIGNAVKPDLEGK